ncbi:MAG: hypothetical protein JO326_10345, partial [Acetobacteraceae bacterium]|nr:hypothetical protein [Acetobacteraceae bacterium]
ALALGGTALAPPLAQAWWRGGVVIGVPFPYPYVYPPPVVVAPPPVVYAPPPPVVYDPNQPAVASRAASCAAGAYICPLGGPVPPGAPCSCPTNNGGRVPGTAR